MTEEEKTPEVDETAPAPNAEPPAPAAESEAVEETAAAAVAEDAPVEDAATDAEAPAKKPAAKKAAAKKPAAKKAAAKKPAAKKPAAAKAEAADEKPAKAEKAKPAKAADGAAPERTVVRAQAKYVRTSARKARLVCDHIRGKSVTDARAILAHTPRAVAEDWSKLLESAVANAEHNHELVGDDLKIHAVFADEGPTIKRYRPRAMGRATPIRKRTSHLTIQLTVKE
jgi:ribosomal protein L22